MLTDGFSKRLSETRHTRNLSIRELARQAELSPTPLTNYESGETFPDIRTLETLAAVLAVSPSWLAFGEHGAEDKARAALEKALQLLNAEPKPRRRK